MRKRIVAAGILFCLLPGLCSCRQTTLEETNFFAMDTIMTFQIAEKDGAAASACRQEVEALEHALSTTVEGGDLWTLNQRGEAALGEDALTVLNRGLHISALTDQAFCLSLYPATQLWGFTGGLYRVPSDDEREAIRPLVDDRLIKTEGNRVTLQAGGALDFGGIAKGYAGEKLAALLRERGIEHAFLSLGGNVQVLGGNPDGSPWRVGIADPEGGVYLGIVHLRDGAVVTSGGYQRNFTQDGVTYQHILDRTTLSPADSGLLSVTVISESGTEADALSTALYVMGEQRALDFCKQQGNFECILVTADHRVVVSEGLKNDFEANNPHYQYE